MVYYNKMISLVLLITPIFLVILLGSLLRQYMIKEDEVWENLNKLAYWVLFPCLLFNKTSVIDLSSFAFPPLAITLIGGFSAAVFFSYWLSRLSGLSNASATSVIQGGGRHNAFVALAIVTQLYGDEGAMIAAIIIAVLVTFTNLVVNIMMTAMMSKNGNSVIGVLADLKRNPFIIAIMLGALFNNLGLGELPILHQFTLSVGETTLTIALLCVGAGLKVKDLSGKMKPCVIACSAKFIVFPLSVYVLSLYFALPKTLTVAAMIFAISPTGAASYPLSKQMGGDAPLMATLISLQTLMAVAIMPLAIYVLM